MKAKVKTLYISNKIYMKKDEVEDHNDLISLFTYNNGDEILTTLGESPTHFVVPSNSYHKLQWDNVVDTRKYEEANTEMTFSGKLRWEQQEVVDKFFKKGRARSGIIQAPCGWGKTLAALISVTTDMSPTGDLLVTSIFLGELGLAACCQPAQVLPWHGTSPSVAHPSG